MAEQLNTYPILKNAPIVEAIIDIQAVLPPDLVMDHLAKMQDVIADRYPTRREHNLLSMQFQADASGVPIISPTTSGITGYVFGTPSANKIVQARTNGFTFSVLKPYDSWTNFRDEARELWQLYTQVAHPVEVQRVAVRYINRIEIPLPFDDFTEYILTVPHVAPGVPQGLYDFFMKLSIPFNEQQAMAVVSAAMPAMQEEAISSVIVFDIDVFHFESYDPQDDALWSRIEVLRNVKNQVFFSSMTPKGLRLFQ